MQIRQLEDKKGAIVLEKKKAQYYHGCMCQFIREG